MQPSFLNISCARLDNSNIINSTLDVPLSDKASMVCSRFGYRYLSMFGYRFKFSIYVCHCHHSGMAVTLVVNLKNKECVNIGAWTFSIYSCSLALFMLNAHHFTGLAVQNASLARYNYSCHYPVIYNCRQYTQSPFIWAHWDLRVPLSQMPITQGRNIVFSNYTLNQLFSICFWLVCQA